MHASAYPPISPAASPPAMAPWFSNTVINVATFLLGTAVLAAGICSSAGHRTPLAGGDDTASSYCERFVLTPTFLIGAAIMEDDGHWEKIRSCLVKDGRLCRRLESDQMLDEFVITTILPLQSGCCKPPTECNFTYLNETYWTKPPGSGGSNSSDPDCDAWSNDQSELCYGCHSCKAIFLGNLRDGLKMPVIRSAAFFVLFVVLFALGCCALRNNRRKYTLVRK